MPREYSPNKFPSPKSHRRLLPLSTRISPGNKRNTSYVECLDFTFGAYITFLQLRQQLAAIQKELRELNPSANSGNSNNIKAIAPNSANSDLDDTSEEGEDAEMAAMRAQLELMVPGSEERKMGAREWKRLKRMPAGSVEGGVVRTYVRTNIGFP